MARRRTPYKAYTRELKRGRQVDVGFGQACCRRHSESSPEGARQKISRTLGV